MLSQKFVLWRKESRPLPPAAPCIVVMYILCGGDMQDKTWQFMNLSGIKIGFLDLKLVQQATIESI